MMLVVLFSGTVIVPLAHIIGHVLERSYFTQIDSIGHAHPDFTALLDASLHVIDNDLECILCNQSTLGQWKTTAWSWPVPKADNPYQAVKYWSDTVLHHSYFLRGPPPLL